MRHLLAIGFVALLAALGLAGLWLARDEGTARIAPALPAQPTAAKFVADGELSPPRVSADARSAAASEALHAVSQAQPSADGTGGTAVESPGAGSIHGHVDTRDGQMPERAWVVAIDDVGRSLGMAEAKRSARRIPGSPMRYRFEGLAPGRYWIQAGATGCRTAHRAVDLLAAESIEHDFVLEPSIRLAVRVVDRKGDPHADAGPWRDYLLPVVSSEQLSVWTPGEPWNLAWNGREARFEAEHGPDGRIGFVDLDCDLPVWVNLTQDRWVWASELVLAGSSEVVFTLEDESERLATLLVRAHDVRSKAPVSEGQVQVTNDQNSRSRIFEGGVAKFERLSPGEYGVTVMASPFGWERRTVFLEAGSATELDLDVGGGVMIEGRLVGAGGAPLGVGNGVYLGRAESATIDRSFVYLTDAAGRFRIPAEPGLYLLRARASDAVSPYVVVDTRQGGVDDVEVRAVTPVVVVLQFEAGTESDAPFRILDEDGRELESGRLRAPLPQRLELPPGTMRLVVRGAGGALHETTFVANEGTLVVPVRP